MTLLLFEDDAFRTLAPLCHSQPAFFLRAGAFTASERAVARYEGSAISYLCRDYLAPSVAKAAVTDKVNKAPGGECLFLNGAALLGGDLLARTLDGIPLGSALVSGGRLLAAKTGASAAYALFGYIKVLLTRSAGEAGGVPPVAESLKKLGLDVEESRVPVARFPWQIVSATGELLKQDWTDFRGRAGAGTIGGSEGGVGAGPDGADLASAEKGAGTGSGKDGSGGGGEKAARGGKSETSNRGKEGCWGSASEVYVSRAAHIVGADSVYLGAGVCVEAGAVIDASRGPVILDDKAKVSANAVIYGPCYVGKKTAIKAGSRIYGPCSFGPVCKLGGEISETVIQGYSNKQHEGFLGHAFLGEWVNLGAGTEVSDLKNNYGAVKVWADGSMVDSGEMFVGPTIGDHSKTGINSTLNTGAVIGFCCNVFGSSYLPKFIPSFSWGGADKLVEYDPAKAIETARVVMSRRGLTMDDVDEDLFRKVYEITRDERGRSLM